jgi:hypothetical protein
MNDSIIICIGTIDSPTFNKCKKIIDKLASTNKNVIKVAVIRNKSPQAAWLNAMRTESVGAKWCLQIDEDMYLKDNAIKDLLRFAKKKEKSGIKILNASSLLYDIFLKRNVGSLKLWNVEALQKLEFRDILGGDRDFAKRAGKLGYTNVETKMVLGYHDSAPTADIAYSKYFEYIQKIRKFSGDKTAKGFVTVLKRKWEKDKDYISKKAYNGACNGMKVAIRDKTKSAK